MTKRLRAYLRLSLGCLRAAAMLSLVFAMAPARSQAGENIEQHLRNQYAGKVFILRNFYSGQKLAYDSGGQLSGFANSGGWTVDGVVQIEDVRVSNHRLTLRAKRLRMGWPGKGGISPIEDAKEKKSKDVTRTLEIEADVSAATADEADAMLAKIFLAPNDHFANLVPDYWKPCLIAALTGNDSLHYHCRLSAEFLAIPGVASVSNSGLDPGLAAGSKAGREVFHVVRGNGVTYAKAINNASPEFSEEARLAKYGGVVDLAFVVDESGGVRDIRIRSPLGVGLDEKAVEAVSKWTFRPGTKDGEPVAVEVNTDVSFNLY